MTGTKNVPSEQKIRNILEYEKQQVESIYDSETDYVMKKGKEYIISFKFSSIARTSLLLGSPLCLKRISTVEKVYMDTTFFGREHTILSLNEKYYYFREKRGGDVDEGKRCLSWIFSYSKSRDDFAIANALFEVKVCSQY